MEPSPTETNGRSHDGRFGRGNNFSTGNPHAVAVGRLRSALLATVTDEDVRVVVTKLVSMAREGDLAAIKLLLDRCVGKFVDRLPSPKPSTLGLPTHDDNGVALTFAEKKEWLRQRILSVGERRSRVAEICRTALARQTEQHETEHEVDSDADEVAT